MNLVLTFKFLLFFQIYSSELKISDEVFQANINSVIKVNSIFCSNDARVVYSIVAPEIIRYVQIKDFFEVKSLEIGYVNNKVKNLSNFSIGYFQMKPQFIEQLEDYLLNNKLVLPLNIILPNEYSNLKKRQTRLNRLQSFEWQLIYAHVFFSIMENKFCNIQYEEKIKFYATAYNFDFKESFEKINAMSKKRLFPWGSKLSKFGNDNYSDLSVEFFHLYSNRFF